MTKNTAIISLSVSFCLCKEKNLFSKYISHSSEGWHHRGGNEDELPLSKKCFHMVGTSYSLCQLKGGQKKLIRTLLAGKPRLVGIHNIVRKIKKSTSHVLASWNVRTLLDNEVWPERRTALLSRELERYRIDIAALQKTHISDQGQLREKFQKFYWSGRPSGELREAGVALQSQTNLLKKSSHYQLERVTVWYHQEFTLVRKDTWHWY